MYSLFDRDPLAMFADVVQACRFPEREEQCVTGNKRDEGVPAFRALRISTRTERGYSAAEIAGANAPERAIWAAYGTT